MTINKTEEEKAQIAAMFLGSVWANGKCVYFDNSMHEDYVCDSIKEMVDLYDLLHSSNPYIQRDAYSHWCSQTTHDLA